ncbi:hypothetical protein Runsl_5726 (plasmid) [Runella slithyformis DSM 19594]|uniref:DUF5640 domain-containing protein n=2 Tax=Runella TaxID=105 RepID=A0A7U3ZRG2_RUNSL|nr:hypothetical protein Runsl_5726 [Runella slithyformis DSM 19594]
MFKQNPRFFTMKKVFFSLFLSIATLAAFAQSPIDGNWKGTRDTPNGTFEVTYTFKVEGNKLTGTWKTQFGEAALEEGKVDGKKISYSISFNDRKMSYTGELVSDKEIMVKSERGEMKLAKQ